MGKAKHSNSVDRTLIVIYYDGYGQEHQASNKVGEAPLQWLFTLDEAEVICRREITKGAIKVEVWTQPPNPEKVAAYLRSKSGSCQQTYPVKV